MLILEKKDKKDCLNRQSFSGVFQNERISNKEEIRYSGTPFVIQ